MLETRSSVKTDCKDCGHTIYHAPVVVRGYNMTHDFENVHVKIYWDYQSRHYLIVIKGLQDKCVMACAKVASDLRTDKEIGRILAWANGGANNETTS